MIIYGSCEKCGKKRLFLRQRSYIVPMVSPKPIKTPEQMCTTCAHNIKLKVIKAIQQHGSHTTSQNR